MLKQTIPGLSIFCTLSPIPGFSGYITRAIHARDRQILSVENVGDLNDFVQQISAWKATRNLPDAAFKEKLLNLARKYISTTKRNAAIDPVANFHLRNGAVIYRLNWLADSSENGMKQSYGLMANYLYDLDNLERNRIDYIENGKINAKL